MLKRLIPLFLLLFTLLGAQTQADSAVATADSAVHKDSTALSPNITAQMRSDTPLDLPDHRGRLDGVFFIKYFLAVTVVVVLLLYLRRYVKLRVQPAQPQQFRVVGRLPLNGKVQLFLVYLNGVVYFLAAGSENVTLLQKLEDKAEVDAMLALVNTTPVFPEVLQKYFKKAAPPQ